ncbi:uncharacterized protein LOC142317771 [Lycorma delicatula]|uniref:uncharacterized protein LOC142317771 n=1 Tax=Lycorma delicatula TaxID=130591 RepID=UPI003F5138F8
MIRVLQANVNRSTLSHSLVSRLVVQNKVDILVITEPNIYEAARFGWYEDTEGDVVLKDVSNRIASRLNFRSKGTVALETSKALIIGVYISPNVALSEFTSTLDTIQEVINNTDKKIIMVGDFNSRLVAAGGRCTNKRGKILTDLMESVGCHCVNDDTPTFVARGHTSILNLTILDNRWRCQQWHWEVMPHDIASDHYATMISLNDVSFKANEQPSLIRFSAYQIDVITNRVATRLEAAEHLTPDTLTNSVMQEMDRE